MKILYLAPEIGFSGAHGGTAHVVGRLTSLSRLGHDVIAVVKRETGQRWIEKKQTLTLLRVPLVEIPLVKQFLYLLFSLLLSVFYLFLGRIDLVYERGRIFGGVGVVLASFVGVRSVYEMNEPYPDIPVLLGEYDEHSIMMRMVRWWHMSVVKRASLVTVTHESLIRHGLAPREKSLVVTYGVDAERFSSVSGKRVRKRYHLGKKFVVLYTGSFAPWHACDQLLRAAAQVVKKNNNVLFLMVGDGGRSSSCRSLVEHFKIQDHVLFTGAIPYEEIPSYVAAADVCVALFDRTYPPFHKYSFFYSPMKIHEYRAAGKPIIASSFGNLKKLVIPHKNGLLVHEHDTSAISNAILHFAQHPRLCQQIGRWNKEQARRSYSWDSLNQALLHAVEISSSR